MAPIIRTEKLRKVYAVGKERVVALNDVDLVLVRLYRPWVSSALLKVLPKTVKKIAVLDRTWAAATAD